MLDVQITFRHSLPSRSMLSGICRTMLHGAAGGAAQVVCSQLRPLLHATAPVWHIMVAHCQVTGWGCMHYVYAVLLEKVFQTVYALACCQRSHSEGGEGRARSLNPSWIRRRCESRTSFSSRMCRVCNELCTWHCIYVWLASASCPTPIPPSGCAHVAPTYLSASKNKKVVHSMYVSASQEIGDVRVVRYVQFARLWAKHLPTYIIVSKPWSDVLFYLRQALWSSLQGEDRRGYTDWEWWTRVAFESGLRGVRVLQIMHQVVLYWGRIELYMYIIHYCNLICTYWKLVWWQTLSETVKIAILLNSN